MRKKKQPSTLTSPGFSSPGSISLPHSQLLFLSSKPGRPGRWGMEFWGKYKSSLQLLPPHTFLLLQHGFSTGSISSWKYVPAPLWRSLWATGYIFAPVWSSAAVESLHWDLERRTFTSRSFTDFVVYRVDVMCLFFLPSSSLRWLAFCPCLNIFTQKCCFPML